MNVIQHNISAMNANRQFNVVSRSKAKITEKLSSGYKINRAADDAAGLAISEKMRRQINGLTQASRNAQDGISLVQIADGAMAEVHDMLHRGTELSVQAANGTLSDQDREYLQQEIAQLKEEIDQIKEKTTFNEIPVLKGEDVEVETTKGGASVVGGLPAWVGIGGSAKSDKYMSDTYTITETYTYTAKDGTTKSGTKAIDHSAVKLDFSSFDGSAAKLDELTAENTGFYSTCCTCSNHYSIQFNNGKGNSIDTSGKHFIYNVDISGATNGTDIVNKVLGYVGSNPQNHFTKLVANGSQLIVYDNRANKSPDDDIKKLADFDKDLKWTSWTGSGNGSTAAASSIRGLFGVGIAIDGKDIPADNPHDIELQVGAESGQTLKIKLPSISTRTLKINNVDISTQSGANSAISSFKSALNYVSSQRSNMGAYQNRLEHTIKNLDNVVENTQAAESQIRDTDMAKAMVQFANENILAQAGVSMLSQANQSSQNILSLLG